MNIKSKILAVLKSGNPDSRATSYLHISLLSATRNRIPKMSKNFRGLHRTAAYDSVWKGGLLYKFLRVVLSKSLATFLNN